MIIFLSKYKSIFYSANIFLIVLYLFPGSILGYFLYGNHKIQPQITSDFLVSSNHVYAFFLLSILGIFSFTNSDKLNFLIIFLLFLSILLDIFHFLMPQKEF